MTTIGSKSIEKSNPSSDSDTGRDREVQAFSDYTTAVFELPQGFKHTGRKSFPRKVKKSILSLFQDFGVDIDKTSIGNFLQEGLPVKIVSPQGNTLWCRAYYSYPQGVRKNFKEWFFNTPTLIIQIVKDKDKS